MSWNPSNSGVLKILEERPDLAAQYHGDVDMEDIQQYEMSDSGSVGSTEDESANLGRLLHSQDPDHPLYIPEGRRLVNNGFVDQPYPNVELMLTTLSFVMTAIQVACVADGKFFTAGSRNTRAANSFTFPLQGIRLDLLTLHNALEAWAKPLTQMGREKAKFGKAPSFLHVAATHRSFPRAFGEAAQAPVSR